MPREPLIVVITGAGSGIGRALAQQAAKAGAFVLLVGRQEAALEETLATIPGGSGAVLRLDVTDAEACRVAADWVGAQYGRVDILINNAGRILVGHVDDARPEEVGEMFRTNLLGPFLMTTAFLPLLRKSSSPRIVNVGSMLGDIAMPMFAAYSASKFGLRGWSDGLRRELREEGIRVIHAAPRATRTGAASAFEDLIEPFKMQVDTPEKTAARIWRDVAKGRRESYPAGIERMACAVQSVAPWIVDRVLASQARNARIKTNTLSA